MKTKHRLKRRFAVAAVALLAFGLIFSSCSKLDISGMNKNPAQFTTINPKLLFTTTELSVSGTRYEVWRANILEAENCVQHLVTTFFSGCNNYTISLGWEHAFFLAAYAGGINGPDPAQVKNIQTVIHLLKQAKKKGEPVANKLAEARILRVYIFSRITDLYGSIPYFEAGKAAWTHNYTPAYDPQKKIYMDFFKELEAAVKQFDPSQPTFGSHDIIYGGKISKWKKWANSLHLRFALRLTKVAPDIAKQEAKDALNAPGGLMTSNADIAYIPQQPGSQPASTSLKQNPISETLIADHEFIAEAFMHWMNLHNDPRRAALATTNVNGEYKGFPSGFIGGNYEKNKYANPDIPYGKQYSRVNPSLMDVTDPFFLQTYAEVEFMKAEVAVRWGLPKAGSAKAAYRKGVTAAMKYLRLYSNNGSQKNVIISDAAINKYLKNNPFMASGKKWQKLNQINTQYWAAVFLNGYEAYANWRRSGYPNLEPAKVDTKKPPAASVTGAQIPRRLLYPAASEKAVNTKSYQAAIARQGPNKLTTRVWWDCGKTADQCIEPHGTPKPINRVGR